VALMARLRSTTPVGVPPRDTSPDASIFRRWLATSAGDVALASDLATGANSTTPIDHSGAPLGCQLRMPLAAQHIGRIIGNVSGSDGNYYILAVPVFVRAGETGYYRLVVDVTPFGDDPVTLEVRNTSWTVTVNPTPGEREAAPPPVADGLRSATPSNVSVSWTFLLATTGIHYILVKRFMRDIDTGATLFRWALDHQRGSAGNSNGILVDGTAVQGSPYGALASYAPANVLEFYDEEVAVDGPLSAWVTSRLNRKVNALWEYVTGGSLPGNVARQISNTWDNNRATWTSEALLEFPITCVALGASTDIANPKTPDLSQLSGWIRYPNKHATAFSSFCGVIVQMPNFRISTSDLRVEVLMDTSSDTTALDGTPGYRFDVLVDGVTASAEVEPVRLAAAPARWWRATITGIPFTAGVTNQFDVRIRHTTGGALGKPVQITGVCVYFDP
jgi:hypothetical protein